MSWRILVIEDDDDLREALVDVLSARGYRVHAAANGAEGLDRVREERPHVIVLDLMMPVMDGPTFLRRRADDAELARVPVVVVTAQPDRVGEVTGALIDVVEKPLPLDRLYALIRQACDRPFGDLEKRSVAATDRTLGDEDCVEPAA